MLRAFLNSYKKFSNRERAFEAGKRSLKHSIASLGIFNKYQIMGLYGELIYFYRLFVEQDLTAEMAIGYKSDFRGRIADRPSAVDVTTNPLYKESEFAEIKGGTQKGWDYYLGLVNIKEADSELYPLLLPVCKAGEIGHFILVIESGSPSSMNLWGESADREYVIKYNPNSGGDESDAIERVCYTYDYIVDKPSSIRKKVIESYTDWAISEPNSPRLKKLVERDVQGSFDNLISHFHRESGLMISAIIESVEQYSWKDEEPYWVTRQFWVHPHQYIRRSLGKPEEIMDFNIAGYIHDHY
jgi:hypothetical protein